MLLLRPLLTGSGAEELTPARRDPEWIIDLHNGGCASFGYMLKLATAIISAGQARTALLANVQNCAGQVFAQSEIRKLAHAATPGDGCGVAYVAAGDRSPSSAGRPRKARPEWAMDLGPATQDGRRYWEPGSGQLDVRFNEAKGGEIIEPRQPPRAGYGRRELCTSMEVEETGRHRRAGANQPNRIFLRNWRETLGISAQRHLDTYDRFGNLYGAGMPVTLDHAARGKVRCARATWW